MSAEASTTTAGDVATGAIVAIPPPQPALRDSVARLIVEILSRQALADVGIIAENDNRTPPQ